MRTQTRSRQLERNVLMSLPMQIRMDTSLALYRIQAGAVGAPAHTRQQLEGWEISIGKSVQTARDSE